MNNSANKIKEFLSADIANLKAEKEEKMESIYRGELNIASIDEAIDRLIIQTDKTRDVFKPCEDGESDAMKEIRLLNEKKEGIRSDISVMKKRIVCIDNRLDKLKEMHNEMPSYDISGYKILAVRESERQRIARDIHDTVIQKMTALTHKTEFVQKVVDSDAQRAKLELEIINKVMHECIDELRDIIYDLRPMSFDDIGFKSTVRRYIDECMKTTQMNISIDMDKLDESSLDNVIELSAFRIIQELTNNSIKYSEGANITIVLMSDKGTFTIKHSDDGKGYSDEDMHTESVNSGFGLAIVKERVKLLNGDIVTDHSGGTVNLITIPCMKIENFN